ncbi:MAG: hypothetical protein PWP15_47 [Methanothermococcus sp.]|uniref:glycosyltransferase n=1 Tax=Methanothermococcus sp. TaxID=2614238 RepID=UPI00258F28F9|nr:glycosyltransferase [Methanothermococcus sp.]MDK2789540.1 hypothetical protein [Methanothermococcus sp.]MDK2946435.1 hypothetical protein [Geotoga sp.]
MKILGLFFTEGISVELWHNKGMFFREKLIYEKLLEKGVLDKIYWFSYGVNDKKYEKYLHEDIEIITMPKIFNFRVGKLIYSFLMPFIQYRYLKKCNIFKTNQMWGSWTAIISKIIYKKSLILRTGYTISLFSLKENKKIPYFINKLIEKLAYKFADFSIVSSNEDYNYVIKNYGVRNIIVNPNYINTDLFKPMNIKKEKDIIFVGRLSKQKNIFNLIKAFKSLNYDLDIYGDGELKEKIEELIKDLKLDDKVKLKGTVPNSELPSILNQYKIYVLPSFYEGMPKTLLEAMACGLPCLGTDVEGTREVIIHGENGWLTNTDLESINKGIVKLMEAKNLRKKLGENARKTIEEKYSLKKVVDMEIEVYENLI